MNYYYDGLNKVAAHSAATIQYSREVAVVTQWWAYETRIQKIRLELPRLPAHQRKQSAVCICTRLALERGAENNVVAYLEYTPANRTAPATTMMVIVLCTMRIIIGTTSTLYYSTVVSTYVLHSADCRSQWNVAETPKLKHKRSALSSSS